MCQVIRQLVESDDADLFAEGLAHHGPHDGPDATEPRGRVDNQERLDARGGPPALKREKEFVYEGNRKVGHFPVSHVGDDADAVPTVVLVLKHVVHDVNEII